MDATTESVSHVSSTGRSSDALTGSAHYILVNDPTHYILISPTAVFVKTALFFLAQGGLEQEWGGEWQPVRVLDDDGDVAGIEAARALGESIRAGLKPRPPSVAELRVFAAAAAAVAEDFGAAAAGLEAIAEELLNGVPGSAPPRGIIPASDGIGELETTADELVARVLETSDAGALCTLCQRGTLGGILGHAESCPAGKLYAAIGAVREQAGTQRTFAQFQALNALRCVDKFHPLAAWLPGGWPLAICGEAGELANLVKKIVRGDFSLGDKRDELLKELADIICYADLMISALGARTDDELYAKFREVSERVGFDTSAALEDLRSADACESCGLPATTVDNPESGVPLCVSCAEHLAADETPKRVEHTELVGMPGCAPAVAAERD